MRNKKNKRFIEEYVSCKIRYFETYILKTNEPYLIDLAYEDGLRIWAITQGCNYLDLTTLRDRMDEYLKYLLADNAAQSRINEVVSDKIDPYIAWFIKFVDKRAFNTANEDERVQLIDKINITYNRLIHAPVFHLIHSSISLLHQY